MDFGVFVIFEICVAGWGASFARPMQPPLEDNSEKTEKLKNVKMTINSPFIAKKCCFLHVFCCFLPVFLEFYDLKTAVFMPVFAVFMPVFRGF